MKQVLIVEDDQDISDLVKIHLTDDHYEATQEFNGRDGLKSALEGDFDLVILDLMLPEMDGIEVCRQIRANNMQLPILMLTARSEEIDKVLGLETGADDYLTKPFGIRELMARVKALLRRSTAIPSTENGTTDKIELHGLSVDLPKRKVVVHGNSLELTPKEFDLLVHLASNPGITFSRDELLSKVWGYEFSGYEHTVNSHINRLRNKVEKDLNDPEFILTTWGVGYKFKDKQA